MQYDSVPSQQTGGIMQYDSVPSQQTALYFYREV